MEVKKEVANLMSKLFYCSKIILLYLKVKQLSQTLIYVKTYKSRSIN